MAYRINWISIVISIIEKHFQKIKSVNFGFKTLYNNTIFTEAKMRTKKIKRIES